MGLQIVHDGRRDMWLRGWCFTRMPGFGGANTTVQLHGYGAHTVRLVNDARPELDPPNTPHEIIVMIQEDLLRFIDPENDPDNRLSFSHIDTSDAFVLPQGTAASIGTRERFEAVTAANRARSRADN